MNLKKPLKSYHASSLSSFKTVCQLLPFFTVLKRRNLAFSGVLKVRSKAYEREVRLKTMQEMP